VKSFSVRIFPPRLPKRWDVTTRSWSRRGLAWLPLAIWLGSASIASAQRDEQATEVSGVRVSDALVVEGAILKTIETTAVAAQVSGLIQNMEIKEGSRVQSGTDIAKVRDVSIRLQTQRTRLAVELAEKKYQSDIDEQVARKSEAVASNEYQRAMDANAKLSNVYPPGEIDRLKLILDRSSLETQRAFHLRELALLEKSIAEIEYQQNQELLLRHRIIAPCTGLVVAVEKRVGEWVEPGTVVARIVEIDRLRIEGFLHAVDASQGLVGREAKVSVEVSGQILETVAELVFISPDVNPLNSQVRVYLEVENKDGRLRPGLRPAVVLHRSP